MHAAILHYALPPVVGGVEATIAYHARGLAAHGYSVRVVGGSGAAFDPRVALRLNPLFGSTHPDILTCKRQLDAGRVPDDFDALVARVTDALADALDGAAVCIAHNVLTLHKNLPLTAALRRLHAQGAFRLVGWCHDLAWTNPLYRPELHAGEPWDLLRRRWQDVTYVTVSEPRRVELAALLGVAPDAVQVVVPGVDPARMGRWTALTARLVERLRLLDADLLLLLPARLTRRKNVALALRVLAALRAQTGADARLIVTGPPGPHNPANPGYFGELRDLRRSLGLDDAAHFLYEQGEGGSPLSVDDDTLSDFFRLCDALLFPSQQEGFGIPVLEAGLNGMPVFCADIPPFRATGRDDADYFPPDGDPAVIAARLWAALGAQQTYRLRVRVRREYRWDAIIRSQILPLLEESP